MKAIWNGITIADSGNTVVVEGNHYFPPDSVDPAYLRKSRMKSLSIVELLAGETIAKFGPNTVMFTAAELVAAPRLSVARAVRA